MTKEHITKLLSEGAFPEQAGRPELIETHISWVFLCDRFVFKIKKPIRYSFLDFSTLEKRKFYCEREVELNRRLTDDMYLDVQPVREVCGGFHVGGEKGDIIDYAVRMRKQDKSRQMDVLLENNKVTDADIKALAEKIARFHQNTGIVSDKDVLLIRHEFNDLKNEAQYLHAFLGAHAGAIIDHAIESSDAFIDAHRDLFIARLKEGFYRDCHGDLHSRNIFLLPAPQPFDCIEFNDEYRLIDILNEVAFLCMDIDAFGRPDLSGLFFRYYNDFLPVIRTAEDRMLFIFYKGYRANIRAKVNSLRARSAGSAEGRKSSLAEADKYLHLLDQYMKLLRQ